MSNILIFRKFQEFIRQAFLFPIVLLPLTCFSQFNPQSKSITENFFPEPPLEITTPAFLKSSGFTNYLEMMAWLQNMIQPYQDKVSISFIGES